MSSIKKIIGSSVVALALIGGAVGGAQASTPHRSVESHGATTWVGGAYEQYWNNYGKHYAYVMAQHGASSYHTANTNGTAYSSVSTYMGQVAYFSHGAA